MDARHYVRYLRMDEERRREEAWREMYRRPDAEPLPDEPERAWSERVIGLRRVLAAARVVRRIPARSWRAHRPPADPTPTVRPRPASRHS